MIKFTSEQLLGEEVVLAPFTLDSILLYHKLKRDGVKVWAFFDNNPKFCNESYGGIPIFRPYNRARGKYLISSELYFDDIACCFEGIGIEAQDMINAENLETNTNDIDIAWDIDAQTYKELVPQYWDGDVWVGKLGEYKEVVRHSDIIQGGGGLAKIKRLRRLSKLWESGREQAILLKRFEFHVTERCTLKCKNCGGLTAYFKSPRDFSLDAMKRDFDAFIRKIDFSDDILIMGGEPFLCESLPELIHYIHAHEMTEEKIGYVRLITNATLMPSSALLAAVKETNTTVWISNYGEKSPRLNELVRLLYDNGIIYKVLHITNWSMVQQLKDGAGASADELREKCKRCMHKHRVVKDGKLFRCAFLAAGEELRCFPSNESNRIDLYGEDFSEKAIIDYLSTDILPPGCAWCVEDSLENWNDNLIPPAVQVKKPIEYKVFD